MVPRQTDNDADSGTIVAPATPGGRSAIAVVRVSGPKTLDVLRRVAGEESVADLVPRRATRVSLRDEGGLVFDEALMTFFRGPRSYTGEDMAEVSVHGSPAVVRQLLRAATSAGARPAAPGEFTLRALRSGKIDLAQAEAVRDLVDAATIEQARIAVRQLRGEVSQALSPIAEDLFDLLADVEAGLDLDEEERALLPSSAGAAIRCERLVERLQGCLDDSASAQRVREGARVVLLGPPNSGKSSVFNVLVGSDRVIVTAEPGTTRDLIEATIVVEGLPVVLIDAAGIGEKTGSRAEQIGMDRALEAARGADLVLEVYDLSSPRRPGIEVLEVPTLSVGTHADRPAVSPPIPGSVVVSCVERTGFGRLRNRMAEVLGAPGNTAVESVALATERHRVQARNTKKRLELALSMLRASGDHELVAVELRAALESLREILGAVGPEELLGRIFSRFCVGK